MNEDLPLVSVRMSAYNHERFVEKAIRSIMSQTYPKIELFVIDDGSSDRTPEIIKGLSEEFGFFFERQENMGLCPTLNKLMTYVNGAFVTGCASDDFWPADRVERQVRHMAGNPEVDVLYGRAAIVDQEGKEAGRVLPRRERALPGFDGFRSALFSEGMFFNAGTAFYRRAVFDTVGLYDTNIRVEDFDWFLRASLKVKILGADEIFSFYRIHGENWSRSPERMYQMYEAERKIFDKYDGKLREALMRSRMHYWARIHYRSPNKSLFQFASDQREFALKHWFWWAIAGVYINRAKQLLRGEGCKSGPAGR